MKKYLSLIVVVALAVCVGLVGCTQKAADSTEAINTAKTLKTTDEQVNYLIKQANAFVNSDEFDQGIKTAQYILSNLDKDSTAAQAILAKAKEEMKAAAQGAAADMQNKLGTIGQ